LGGYGVLCPYKGDVWAIVLVVGLVEAGQVVLPGCPVGAGIAPGKWRRAMV